MTLYDWFVLVLTIPGAVASILAIFQIIRRHDKNNKDVPPDEKKEGGTTDSSRNIRSVPDEEKGGGTTY